MREMLKRIGDTLKRGHRTIGAALLAGLLFMGLAAQAQQYKVTTLLDSSSVASNKVFAYATSNFTTAQTMTLTKYDEVALSISFAEQTGAVGSNVVFTFGTSLDGTTWPTTNQFVVTLKGASTSAITTVTNVPPAYIGAAGYFRLQSIQDVNSGAGEIITNITVKAATKPSRRGN